MRLNQPIAGLFIGLFMPLLGFIVVYFIMGSGVPFSTYMERLSHSSKAFATVISLSVLANLIPFLYFNSKRLDQAVKGIVIATMLYAVVFVYVKFVM